MARFEKNCLFADKIDDGGRCKQTGCKYNNNNTGKCDYSGYITKITAKVQQSMDTQRGDAGAEVGGTNA